jgi:small-conductance mechanosensitive channel
MPDAQTTTEALAKWWQADILGSPAWAWIAAAAIAALVFFLLIAVRAVLLGRLKAPAEHHPLGPFGVGLRLVRTTSTLVLFVVAAEVGVLQLALSPKIAYAFRVALGVALGLQAVLWGRQVIEIAIEKVLAKKHGPDGKPDPTVLTALTPIRFASSLVLVTLVALIVLDNAGINVTALVAGVGIGGIALALAAQKILANLFGAVSIVLDKPFVIGDFIVTGNLMGTVESIGMKTTRLRALSGEQLVFPNDDLLSSRIQNFQRMTERRVVLAFGVVYATPPQALRRINDIVKDAVARQADTRFERCHFKNFGPSSLDFECVYYVLSPDYTAYMDVQQAINLEVLQSLAAEGIAFAYPTQTVYQYAATQPMPETRGTA